MANQKYNIGDLIKMSHIYYTSESDNDKNRICIVLEYNQHPFEHYILTNLFDDGKIYKFSRTKEFVEKYYDLYKA